MELTGTTVVTVPPLLNPQTIAGLRSDLDAALADPVSHVVILLGGDDVFCRGLDLSAVASAEDARTALERFAGCLQTVRLGGKPVIGLVRGACVAGGVGLAAACDGLLATTDATFALTELLFGLVPAIILPYLAQRVSAQKLRWMALSAQTLTAGEALQLGLADRVCASENTSKVLRSWARQLRRVQPSVVGMWKRMTANLPALPAEEGVQITMERLSDPAVRMGFLEFIESGHLPSTRGDS